MTSTDRHEEQDREHTRLLTPMIRDLLADAGLSVQQLDAIVLGNGPGSFIGMRIAASVAQGLAHGAGIGIAPVSSLAAVAAEVFAASGADEVVVAQDAHMNEVYLGAFRRGADNLPEAIFPERLQSQTLIEGLDESSASRSCGSRFWLGAIPGARCGERQSHRVAVGCRASQGALSAVARRGCAGRWHGDQAAGSDAGVPAQQGGAKARVGLVRNRSVIKGC